MHKSKTLRRLGLGAGVATVVGTMSMALMPAAFASSVTSPNLTVNPTTVNTAATSTNGFTATTAIPAAGSITINSLVTGGGAATAANSMQFPAVVADYTVTCSPSCNTGAGGSNTVTGVAGTPEQAVISLTTPITTGAVVTVTITATQTPTAPSSVQFGDSTSTDTTQVLTNSVAIGNATAVTPTVTDMEPHTLPSATASPFTLTGSNFFGTTAANVPNVCFIVAGSTPGAEPAGTANPAPGCPASTGTGGAAAFQAALTSVSATQIQGTTPAGITAGKWDTVVYNWNPNATGGAAYTAPSAVSSADQLITIAGLDFIPESGSRVADSRSGDNLPKGGLTSGGTVSIPIADFNNSATQPDNLPAAYVGISMNVTAVAPASVGNLQVFPTSAAGAACTASKNTTPANTNPATVNFQPPQDTSNDTIVPTPAGTTGICITDNGAAVQVVMDMTGYAIGGGYTGSAPGATNRVVDSRSGVGLQGPLVGGKVFTFNMPAVCQPVANCGGQTVALNVAATNTTAVGNLRVFPATGTPGFETCPTTASSVPNTAVVNYIPGVDSSSFYIVKVPFTSAMCVYSDSPGTMNAVIDYYGTVTSGHVTALTSPYRVVDTRGSGGIAAGSHVTVQGAPSGTGSTGFFTPATAVAIIGSVSDILPASVGNLRTYPDGTPVPNAATMPHYPNQIRENLAMIALNPANGSFDIFSDGANTNSTFDATAYIS